MCGVFYKAVANPQLLAYGMLLLMAKKLFRGARASAMHFWPSASSKHRTGACTLDSCAGLSSGEPRPSASKVIFQDQGIRCERDTLNNDSNPAQGRGAHVG